MCDWKKIIFTIYHVLCIYVQFKKISKQATFKFNFLKSFYFFIPKIKVHIKKNIGLQSEMHFVLASVLTLIQ